jgi:NAD(P)-dependent dehydrogenase (short-subunit alcohol dehydrogenase family)
VAIDIKGRVVLVTGANRGIGRALVDALVAGGARHVWAAARSIGALRDLVVAHPGRVTPLELDVTDPSQVARAAESASDVEVLVNNAGAVFHFGGAVTDAAWLEAGRKEMDVNVFGPLALTQAFAAVLKRNGGGAVVNVISVAGLVNFPSLLSYSASKAALHSVTQALRIALRSQGTQVFGVYPGPVDTDMARPLELTKATPASVALAIVQGLHDGQEDIFPDPAAAEIGQVFREDPKALEAHIASQAA